MHIPVLLKETIELLNVGEGKRYVDATLGLGGHSAEIIRRGGHVLGIEADRRSFEEVLRLRSGQADFLEKATLVQGNFKDIERIAAAKGFVPCDGVLFDLGMSSWQLEKSRRGFSFQRNEPLDMRMDEGLAVTAADLLNGLSRDELVKLFQKYGEEQFARRIASAVVRARSLKPFETTEDLTKVIREVRGEKGRRRIDPATRVFQALRIAVNDEIVNLRTALPRAFGILGAGGRLAVISFHSLEDREVKNFFRSAERQGAGAVLTAKPVVPSEEEVRKNRRSRSAKLRVIEKRGGIRND
jgi:16S rRNA (cytosine1402-N4)-methyltransferase